MSLPSASHGLLHYPRQIRKFGSPLNFFGGFLESFLKDFLKRPSKRVNGHTHRLQYNILVRSQESWQFDIARRIIFPSAYECSFTEDDKEMAEIGLPNPPPKDAHRHHCDAKGSVTPQKHSLLRYPQSGR